ncbi:N-acetylglucosamine-6-phosphate deacetylase [Kroppenstedtia eburnea]|uniref:N-acetylglucosamine-6-phosphate deacetylase n=1 Tax=Kroppenstedtia eburnea TaxID=714067 RepID=A0A1N7NB10_9BACL|nr:N-acetylglucosamine-6-phosphate deacetylase [Kroppenstedtia eburnea]QKI83103.1 N-acetylglucosamine-6-phosphate deacetylase [Kroppenstedtia eburnea]SIS95492.1 N-acetylglucosamine-6-phosphate deacetylase [Kroppenstedtia eburnea]
MVNGTGRKVFRGKVILREGMLEDGMVVTVGERIEYVGSPLFFEEVEEEVRVEGWIWPGLIDLHVHGAGGSDVMDGTPEALHRISNTLVAHGVTGFLATTVTMDKPRLERAILNTVEHASSAKGAEILGVHLEGPWICPAKRGAQNPEYITDPRPADAKWVLDVAQGNLRLITLAPERPGALDLIRRLSRQGVVVSVGHSSATHDEVEAAVEAGASHVTHIFNGMTGLHHREPGVAGTAMADDRLTVELIGDGFHVHPTVIKLLARTKPTDGLILISDGMRAVGQPEGFYDLGGLKVRAEGGKATLEDGSLAGSLLTLDRAVHNTARYAGVPLWKAVRMASLAPARRLGLDRDRGSLEAGKRADLLTTDEYGRVTRVWIRGREVPIHS